jgi:5-methyltetrahydrofolate corrinoid/iron sulfur protein methyltransferase
LYLAADNVQVMDMDVERALNHLDPGPLQDLTLRCEEAGADYIDVNPGPLTGRGKEKMTFLVEAIQAVSSLPLILDTANTEAMAAGLDACKKPPILNGFSMEPAKLKRVLPLARDYNCRVIGFLLMPDGRVPSNADERLSVAVDLFEAFSKAGLPPRNLIIDPVLVPVMWENGQHQAMEVLKTLRMLPDLLGFPATTMVGLSNLTWGRGRGERKALLEQTYLPMLAASGLDMVLMNMLHAGTVAVARTINALTGRRVFTLEEIP